MTFTDLSLSPVLLRAVEQEGYSTPTPIQALAIPPALEGRDVLGCAQTGTGKTAAFVLPLLNRLMREPRDKTARGPALARALILSPTRELASQIGESIERYGRETGLTHTVIYGGVSQFHQERALRRGVDIIVATPGRLIDLMDQGIADLRGVRAFVLDEADRMLDMGFIKPIRRIAAAVTRERQTLLFSATMPDSIVELAESLLRDPVRVSVAPKVKTAEKIEQGLYYVDRAQKLSLLEFLLRDAAASRVVVFTRTKHGAEKLGRKLAGFGVGAETIHGNKAQNARRRALESFRSGRARVLVATDVAARGLDIDDVTHVVNYDLPVEPEAYVHRIGRTARAGASGKAISFCDSEERGLLKDIEKMIGRRVPVLETPELPKVERREAAPRPDTSRPQHAEHRHNERVWTQPSHAKPQGNKPRRSYGFDQPLDVMPEATPKPRVFGAKRWTKRRG